MEQENKSSPTSTSVEDPERRKLFDKFGKLAAYAAPFTILALAEKADAATSSGPGKGPHARSR